MTKGRGTLPLRAVAGQKAFFISLGGPQAHDFSSLSSRPKQGVVERPSVFHP
jgi:hypothetical protein